MRIVPFVVAFLLSAGSVQAAETCKANADEKKLSGAARTSFLTKCEKELDGSVRDDGDGAQAGRCGSDKLRHQVCERRRGHLNGGPAIPPARGGASVHMVGSNTSSIAAVDTQHCPSCSHSPVCQPPCSGQ